MRRSPGSTPQSGSLPPRRGAEGAAAALVDPSLSEVSFHERRIGLPIGDPATLLTWARRADAGPFSTLGLLGLLDLPAGAPLGVGGVPFRTAAFDLGPGDQLVLYTDGLVETRDQPIDQRLNTLLGLLDDPERPLEETCDRLLHALRHPDDHDDVALLIARARPTPHQASRP